MVPLLRALTLVQPYFKGKLLPTHGINRGRQDNGNQLITKDTIFRELITVITKDVVLYKLDYFM